MTRSEPGSDHFSSGASTTDEERVAVVTGGSGGLGAAIARRFSLGGFNVMVNYHSSGEQATALARELGSEDGRAVAHGADVSSSEAVSGMVDDAIERWGRIDVLVNNSGGAYQWVGFEGHDIVDTDDDAWNGILDVNLTGAFNCIRAVAPHMIETGGGHILNVGSSAGALGRRRFAAYSAAKAGLVALSKAAARELGEFGIQVNTACPGLVVHDRLVEAGFPDEQAVQISRTDKVLGTTGDAEEFAGFVFHVAQMKRISGQLLNADSRVL